MEKRTLLGLKDETRFKLINGYKIKYNDFWSKYQVSHIEIGINVAEFDNINEAMEYCEKG